MRVLRFHIDPKASVATAPRPSHLFWYLRVSAILKCRDFS